MGRSQARPHQNIGRNAFGLYRLDGGHPRRYPERAHRLVPTGRPTPNLASSGNQVHHSR